jgi:hypothetical protein
LPLEFQIAVAPHPDTEVAESLSFVLDGKPSRDLDVELCADISLHNTDDADVRRRACNEWFI